MSSWEKENRLTPEKLNEEINNSTIYLWNVLGKYNIRYGLEKWYTDWKKNFEPKYRQKLKEYFGVFEINHFFNTHLKCTRILLELFIETKGQHVETVMAAMDILGQILFLNGYLNAAFHIFNFNSHIASYHNTHIQHRMENCWEIIGSNYLLNEPEHICARERVAEELEIKIEEIMMRLEKLATHCNAFSDEGKTHLAAIATMYDLYFEKPF